MFEGLSDDKFYGKDKGISQTTNEYDTATNTYEDPPDKIHHNAIYAENLNELYMYQVNKNFSQKSVSPFIPAITFEVSVQGVVVHTSRYSFCLSVNEKRTKTDL